MTQEKDYKELLYEEKLDRINEKLDDLKDMMGQKASSSSVLRLEQRLSNLESAHIPCASVVLVRKEVEELQKELKPIKEATDGAVYFGKHPNQLKMLILGAVILVCISAAGLIPSYVMWKRYKIELKAMELTQQAKENPKNN